MSNQFSSTPDHALPRAWKAKWLERIRYSRASRKPRLGQTWYQFWKKTDTFSYEVTIDIHLVSCVALMYRYLQGKCSTEINPPPIKSFNRTIRFLQHTPRRVAGIPHNTLPRLVVLDLENVQSDLSLMISVPKLTTATTITSSTTTATTHRSKYRQNFTAQNTWQSYQNWN